MHFLYFQGFFFVFQYFKFKISLLYYVVRQKIYSEIIFNVNPTLLCDRKTATTKGFLEKQMNKRNKGKNMKIKQGGGSVVTIVKNKNHLT